MPCNRLTLETEILLLDFFRDNPCLWHSKHSDYSNKKVRNAKLNEAAQLISVGSGKDAYEKFRNLRTTYYRELKRTTETEGHKSKWRHFSRMSFLRQSMSELDTDDPHNDDSLVSDRSGHGAELEVSVVTNHSLNSAAAAAMTTSLSAATSGATELSQHVPIITPLNSQVLYTVNSDNKLAIANMDGTAAQLSALPGQIVSSNLMNTRILPPGMGQRITTSPMILQRATLQNGVGAGPTIVGVQSPKSKGGAVTGVSGTATLGTSQLITVNPGMPFYSVVTEPPPATGSSTLLAAGAKRTQATINNFQTTISTQKTLQITPTAATSAKRAKTSASSSATTTPVAATVTLPSRQVALLHSPTVSQHNLLPSASGNIVSSTVPQSPCGPLGVSGSPSQSTTFVTNHLPHPDSNNYVKKTDLSAIIKTEFQKLLSEDSDLLFALSVTQSLKSLSATARESLKLSIQKCVLDITIQNSNQALAAAAGQTVLQMSQTIPSISNHTIAYQVPGPVQVQVANGLNNNSSPSDINGHKSVNGHSATDGKTPPTTICVIPGATVVSEQTNGPSELSKGHQDSGPIVCVSTDLRTTTAITSVQADNGAVAKIERH